MIKSVHKVENVKRKYLALLLLIIYMLTLGVGAIVPTPSIVTAEKSITLNKTNITLVEGSKELLKVNHTSDKVVWSSSKPKVATVNENGRIKAKKPGTTLIKAKVASVVLKCEVTVVPDGAGLKGQDIDGILTTILNDIIDEDMTRVEKVRACHDYLVLHTQYDYDNYLANTIPKDSYQPEGVLYYGIAVCQGYAETFQLMMEALNIPCKLVYGTAGGGNHAWNQVKLNGNWYHIDVTWDDPIPDVKGRVFYNYFLVTDEQVVKDHVWNKKLYEVCNSYEYFYFGYKDYIVKNQSEAEALFAKQYEADTTEITILLPKDISLNYSFIFKYVNRYQYYTPTLHGEYYIYRIVI